MEVEPSCKVTALVMVHISTKKVSLKSFIDDKKWSVIFSFISGIEITVISDVTLTSPKRANKYSNTLDMFNENLLFLIYYDSQI